MISKKDARNEIEIIYDLAKGLLNNDFYEYFISFASESRSVSTIVFYCYFYESI